MFPEFRDCEVGPLISEPTLAESSGGCGKSMKKGWAKGSLEIDLSSPVHGNAGTGCLAV